MNLFYLICPIGLENTVLAEMKLKNVYNQISELNVLSGGIEFSCELELGLSLNLILKTPTRILLRLKSRKCRDFPKLFKTIGQIPWREYLVQEEVDWRISSSNSRIINTSKAQESCVKALNTYFKANALTKKLVEQHKDAPVQKVYLRLDHDMLTISIDTSGELLHIRGLRTNRGKASLRESYAACLLLELFKDQDLPIKKLVDPMCGTGSFLFEAKSFFKLNGNRDFPFLRWKIVNTDKLKSNVNELDLVENCFGLDIDPAAKSEQHVTISTHDIFDELTQEQKEKLQGGFLICNPPYGKRIKIKGSKTKYFESLIERIETEFKPKAYGIIIPTDVNIKFKTKVPFNNNSVKVNFCIKQMTR
ncbi:MAG: hypothetical protein KC478_01760 [Bacteriovoracaceae bacterium]|nr:hypothetical protein [Bacteriovoracaceae bacterium]